MRKLLAVLALCAALPALAQSTVILGQTPDGKTAKVQLDSSKHLIVSPDLTPVSNGQQAMTGSVPVVIASDQSAIPVTTAAATGLTVTQVLVLNTATSLGSPVASRKAVEVQNLGPNAIYCADSALKAVAGQARMLVGFAAGGVPATWAVGLGPGQTIYCIAATASQIAGAATVVSETN